jgi:hypothetical protein
MGIAIFLLKNIALFVILNPSPAVILSPARVILSEAKDLGLPRGENSVKNLGDSSANASE